MSYCELCGSPAPDKKKVMVDRTLFTVCLACSKRGKPYNPGSTAKTGTGSRPAPKRARPLSNRISMSDATVLDPDFAGLIREARMKQGLTHEQLGMKMNEKATLLRKIESGALKPDELFARKLERFLDIKLYTSVSDEDAAEADTRLKKGWA